MAADWKAFGNGWTKRKNFCRLKKRLFYAQKDYSRQQVFVVATANYVSMLPSELLRRGRFDELFFVDLPTADERREILFLYMRKYLNVAFAGGADTIVNISEGFTGADLESTVRDLAYRVIANENFILNEPNIVSHPQIRRWWPCSQPKTGRGHHQSLPSRSRTSKRDGKGTRTCHARRL